MTSKDPCGCHGLPLVNANAETASDLEIASHFRLDA